MLVFSLNALLYYRYSTVIIREQNLLKDECEWNRNVLLRLRYHVRIASRHFLTRPNGSVKSNGSFPGWPNSRIATTSRTSL